MFQTTAFDVWRKEEEFCKIFTFIRGVDDLAGGLPLGSITELCGGPGMGKTLLCLQLCVNVQFPDAFGGVDVGAYFIDTNQGFSPYRLKDFEVNQIYNKYFHELVQHNEDFCKNVDVATAHAKIRRPSLEHSPEDVWIFGYGSLMWKIDFPCIDWKRGYICGYLRRFYQHSIDHRGVHEKPGRVVTLVPASAEDRVFGVAYRVAVKDRESVLKHLDFREKNGYERCSVTFHVSNENGECSKCFELVIYIATANNESWAGDGQLSEIEYIAQQICTSAGPSGRNRDYLFSLVKSMEHLFPGIHDDHLLQLYEAVLKFIEEREPKHLELGIKKELKNLYNCDSDKAAYKLNHLIKFCKNSGWKEYFLAKELYGVNIANLWCEK